MFLDNLACDGGEQTLIDCPRGSRLGLITEDCTCTTFPDCVEDLGVLCPGLLNNSDLHKTLTASSGFYEAAAPIS